MREALRKRFNDCLDRLVHPEVKFMRAWCAAYKMCVYTGVVSGVLLVIVLGSVRGNSVLIVAGSSSLGIIVALALAMLTKIFTGAEHFTFYHYEIVVVAVVSTFLWLTGLPLLTNLDLIILALGMADACGRVGCLMVGCCHGRPHDWGVRYKLAHAAIGFDWHLVGVRLFPIQIVESLWMFATVAVGSALFLTSAPGNAFTWRIMAYGAGRFYLEFARGDLGRPFVWGFSEGQWTSFLFMCAALAGEQAGLLPYHRWHAILIAVIAANIICVASRRRFEKIGKHRLLHPAHLKEFAEAVETVSRLAAERAPIPRWNTMSANIHLETTSLGIQISASQINGQTGPVHCYVLSCRDRQMTPAVAEALSVLIIRLRCYYGPKRIVAGKRGIFHLVIQSN
jgi:prolipoprotein diacylglyceryltransferase